MGDEGIRVHHCDAVNDLVEAAIRELLSVREPNSDTGMPRPQLYRAHIVVLEQEIIHGVFDPTASTGFDVRQLIGDALRVLVCTQTPLMA